MGDNHGPFMVTCKKKIFILEIFSLNSLKNFFNTNENLSAELLKNNIEQLAQLFSYKKNKSLKSIRTLGWVIPN